MLSIDRALEQDIAVGRKVPLPWPQLQSLVSLNTRELAILAGAPGSGKSTFAVNLAVKAEVPVLYLTQDSPASVFNRMAALILNEPIAIVRKRQQAGGAERDALIDAVHRRMPQQTIIEGGRRTIGDIERRIVAMKEWLGHAPNLVIVDNLIDLDVDGSHHQETAFYARALTSLKTIANVHDVCLFVLHHVLKSGEKGDGVHPITLTDLLHGGEREARHVHGIYHDEDATTMYVQVLKQQDGAANPSGELRVPLAWVPEIGTLVGKE